MNKIKIKIRPAREGGQMDMRPPDSSKGVEYYNGDCIAEAFDEEGNLLSSHYSSSYGWAEQDIQHPHHHEEYKKRYPDGYEVVLTT